MAQVFQDLYKEFEEKGMGKGKIGVAKELILMRLDVEQIIQATDLSRGKIMRLRRELKHQFAKGLRGTVCAAILTNMEFHVICFEVKKREEVREVFWLFLLVELICNIVADVIEQK